MIATANAAAVEVLRLCQVSWSPKDAVAGLTTVDEVLFYDITAGW